jgi:hypothetical protein
MDCQAARGSGKELNPLGPARFNGESPPLLLHVIDTCHTVENLCHYFVKKIAANPLKRIGTKAPLPPARIMRHLVDNGSGVDAFGCRRVVKGMSSICGRELTISGQICRISMIAALKLVHRNGWRSVQAAARVNNCEVGAHGIWCVFYVSRTALSSRLRQEGPTVWDLLVRSAPGEANRQYRTRPGAAARL